MSRDDPEKEPVDDHRHGPLDNDEVGSWLDRDDPRRAEAEKRLGRKFDDEEEGFGHRLHRLFHRKEDE